MLFRIKFAKREGVRYISHLQLMNTIRRIARRAQLPVAFSEGFNPHIKIAMGPPLAVGLVSEGEYLDLELVEEMEIDELLSALNNSSPDAICFLQAKIIPEGIKSLSALVDTAVYLLYLEFSSEITKNKEQQMLDEFISEESIKIIRHRRRKKDREIDLKPRIYGAELSAPGIWRFSVMTGSRGNVRPEEIGRALSDKYSCIRELSPLEVLREGLFVRQDNKIYPPYAEKIIRG